MEGPGHGPGPFPHLIQCKTFPETETHRSSSVVDVACQRDGTTVLPRVWDRLDVLLSIAGLRSGVNGDAAALPVGGAFDDEGVGA